MLNTQTVEKLKLMKLHAMAKALEEQANSSNFQSLSFEERFAFIVEKEFYERDNRRLRLRLQQAKLRQEACFEDIDFASRRALDKSMVMALASCQWIHEKLNILITGPTGVGKSFIACAFGHKACLNGFKVKYLRIPRLFQELTMARGAGSYAKWINALAKIDLIILDDWGLSTFNTQERRDLLEILEDRYGLKSTLLVSQLPIEHWHEVIGDPTLADAILDRLVHNAYQLNMKGDSMRKKNSKLTKSEKKG